MFDVLPDVDKLIDEGKAFLVETGVCLHLEWSGVYVNTTQDMDGTVRVLFMSDHFGYGGSVIHGATRYFLTVLPRLKQRGVDLHVAFLRGDHPASVNLKKVGVAPTFFGRRKWSPLSVLDILMLTRREHIQVIHCAGMKGIMTARIAGRLAGVPIVAHLHDCEPVTPMLRWPMRWTTHWSARTLSVSRDVAEHAHEAWNLDMEHSEVLPNGLVLEDMRRTPMDAGQAFRERYGLLPDVKVIGIIGRLAPVKGHDILLRAMPEVLAKEPMARLLIIGDGQEREALNKRVHELGLHGYVTFTGQIDDVSGALRAIDVVAMPSLREGLPYALLEAMAMDKPVVASAVGGLAETIRHCENGVLFRSGDAQALAKALISVLTDPMLAQTVMRGAHETVHAYDIERHVSRLIEIYRALAVGQLVPPAPEAPVQPTSTPKGIDVVPVASDQSVTTSQTF